jgi:hypothetical protein
MGKAQRVVNKRDYPDVFGFITDTPPHNVGAVQVAMALREPVARAGRPLEVIMLIQNTSDAPVDVAVRLRLPEKDASGKKGRFITSKERLVVGVEPAEVGYVMLPLSTLPDTAPGRDYSIAMEVNARQLDKGASTVRHACGKRFDPHSLPTERQQQLADLKALEFSTSRRGLLRGNTLEASLGILAGKVGSLVNLKPGWVSLWTLDDHDDVDWLLHKYREPMLKNVLPALRRDALYQPLLEKTAARYTAAGYPLRPIEAAFVTKLLTLIVEYADATNTRQDERRAGHFHLRPLVDPEHKSPDDRGELPRWVRALLRAVARDERVARVPVKAIPALAYDDLLHDGLMYAFAQVERAAGESLGSGEEMDAYAVEVVQSLKQKSTMNFSYVYMPLIIGSVQVYESLLVEREKPVDLLQELRKTIEERFDERTPDNKAIFSMALNTIDEELRKYGYLD